MDPPVAKQLALAIAEKNPLRWILWWSNTGQLVFDAPISAHLDYRRVSPDVTVSICQDMLAR
ncbi:hypothetical protein Pla22_44520 [Rubripirellula amarantea]|uniref:Uncharacterized protein n=1 Tax=Rubripirellula amarantea TaxID=2527999 RepID=A0A5C5WEK3_9BACT|nr:hypothetical protein Pla22_44520 [Rubripirellula amarantea]